MRFRLLRQVALLGLIQISIGIVGVTSADAAVTVAEVYDTEATVSVGSEIKVKIIEFALPGGNDTEVYVIFPMPEGFDPAVFDMYLVDADATTPVGSRLIQEAVLQINGIPGMTAADEACWGTLVSNPGTMKFMIVGVKKKNTFQHIVETTAFAFGLYT